MDRCVKIGLLGMLVTGIIYFCGIMTPQVPLDEIVAAAKLPADAYLEKTGMPASPWSWTKHLNKGDVLVYLPVAWLSLITILCYCRVLPLYLKGKDRFFVGVIIIEIIVLSLAASGLCNVGH